MTTSFPLGNFGKIARTCSRKSLFILFRTVARLSTFVETTNANRETPRLLFMIIHCMSPALTLFPFRITSLKSRAGSLWGRGSMDLNRKLAPACKSSALEHFATDSRFHSHTEPVCSRTLFFLWLINTLWHNKLVYSFPLALSTNQVPVALLLVALKNS